MKASVAVLGFVPGLPRTSKFWVLACQLRLPARLLGFPLGWVSWTRDCLCDVSGPFWLIRFAEEGSSKRLTQCPVGKVSQAIYLSTAHPPYFLAAPQASGQSAALASMLFSE